MSFVGNILKALFATPLETKSSPRLPKALQGYPIDSKPLIKYVRKRKRCKYCKHVVRGKGNPIGVILAYVADGKIYVGYSLANIKAGDQFDKQEGLDLAFERSVLIDKLVFSNCPHAIKHELEVMGRRARSYFQQSESRQEISA